MSIERNDDTVRSYYSRVNGQTFQMLVGLCRDASIVVRVAAVGALGEVAALRPDRDALDAFLAGPMHQLSDPETKVFFLLFYIISITKPETQVCILSCKSFLIGHNNISVDILQR